MNRSLRSGVRSRRQRGAALIVSVLLFAVIGVTALLAFARASESEAGRDRRTTEALAAAKAALIGFAGGTKLTGSERPGDLPCPDLDNDGSAELSCPLEAQRLGRLPWKTLGLPDLRDGDGERLWYAVSKNFKNNPRTPCPNHADAGCLNSNSLGTITLRDASGAIVHDATNLDPITHNGIVAVVIAPGAVLARDDSPGSPQVRDATGINNSVNYMDVAPAGGEDNANFVDTPIATTNGFISGPVMGPSGQVIVNDRIAAITLGDILPVLERRVVQEVAVCLRDYAAANVGRKYPWAADMLESGLNNNYLDSAAATAGSYGRIPDAPFTRTQSDDGTMGAGWVGACKIPPPLPAPQPAVNWWTNWKSQVLYAIAPAFQPGGAAACGACLTVNRPNGAPVASVRVVAMASGRALSGQNRILVGANTNPANYVEFENATSDAMFEIRFASVTFNDRLAYFPMP